MSRQLASYPSLKDRVVLVTGGGSGIGETIVSEFCQQGAKVAFVDIKVQESQALVEKLKSKFNNPPLFLYCDIRDIEALKSAIESVKTQLGNISVLVNNAANDNRHSAASLTTQAWDDSIAINLRPSFFAAQAVLPQMIEKGQGSIINFGSVCWMIKQGGMSAYSSCKAAMMGLTRDLAYDFGQHGIRVNTLVPGWVMTQRQLSNWVDESTQKWIRDNQCLKQELDAQDIANMVMFLSADDSAMISAQTLIVDGGLV
ncbi:SDR family oxidoreductase [Catenovulum sp. 2E275]|uniref:SDR family NAD(P)-dependent oxidoreductase n=1 Tax=Catenovulum sp. 2E275 TaxID=2980497 RepID=UPI0021D00244|nr:SDR family oxidoreductase [Catenovulum sp. 2E275]MCU4676108.1 SDR family oxidoreductase [Catenovulum sp. 2E275]